MSDFFTDIFSIISYQLHDSSFWFLISFLLFVYLIGRRAWPFIAKGLDSYSEGIKEKIFNSTNKKKQSAENLSEAKEQYSESSTTAKSIINHSKFESERLKSESDRVLERFMLARDRVVENRIISAEEQALKDIRNKSALTGIEAVKFLLNKKMNSDVDSILINEAIDELEKIKNW